MLDNNLLNKLTKLDIFMVKAELGMLQSFIHTTISHELCSN